MPDVDLSVILQRLIHEFVEDLVAQIRDHFRPDPVRVVVADERREILHRPRDDEDKDVDRKDLPGEAAARADRLESELPRPAYDDFAPLDGERKSILFRRAARFVQHLGQLRVVVDRVQQILDGFFPLLAGQPGLFEDFDDVLRLFLELGRLSAAGSVLDGTDQAGNHQQAHKQ